MKKSNRRIVSAAFAYMGGFNMGCNTPRKRREKRAQEAAKPAKAKKTKKKVSK